MAMPARHAASALGVAALTSAALALALSWFARGASRRRDAALKRQLLHNPSPSTHTQHHLARQPESFINHTHPWEILVTCASWRVATPS